MSIGINAASLGTESFELELPGGAGGDIHIVLGPSGGLTGRYEQDGRRIALRGITAHQLSLQSLSLPLARGTLRVDAPSILSGVGVDARLGGGQPLEGRLTSASAGLSVVFERGPLLVRAGLSLRGLLFEQGSVTGRHAELESLEVETLRVELDGKAVAHVERLSLRGVRCTIERGGELSLVCAAARAESLVVEQGGRSLRLAGVAFPNGLTLQRDVLRWPELGVERLEVSVPELPRRPAPAAGPSSAAHPPLELSVLDHLQGLIAFDLLLDVRIPILPDRRATHSIRADVSEGAIDFKQLERGLAKLENMLFDFEVNDEGLILELDPIPGLTLDNVTLVTWPLEGREHAQAKTFHRVRLRRLLDYWLNPKIFGSGQPSQPARSHGPSALRRLHVGNIETRLTVGGPVVQAVPGLGTLRLGAPGTPAAAELRLSGDIDQAPGEPPAATELRLDGRDLVLGATIADARGRRAELGRVDVARIDALRLGLLGLQPRRLSLVAEGLRLSEVELGGWLGVPRA